MGVRRTIILNDSPVEEKVWSSTPVMRVPREIGNEDEASWTDRSCRTTACERERTHVAKSIHRVPKCPHNG